MNAAPRPGAENPRGLPMTDADALRRLQEIDLELLRISKEGRELPQRAKIDAAKAARKKVDGELTKIVGQRKDLEIELNDLGHRRRDCERQLDEISASQDGNSDYRAAADLEARLTMIAKKLERIDFESDAVTERLITAERAEKNARGLQERLDTETASLAASAKEALLALRDRQEALTRERESISGSLPPELQLRYIKARKRFGTVAVETLDGNKPSACRVTLQPSQYSDLKRRAQPVDECPYCHRILITDFS